MERPSDARLAASVISVIGAFGAVFLAAFGEPWSGAVIFLVAMFLSGAVIFLGSRE